jgi:hypothetical protein
MPPEKVVSDELSDAGKQAAAAKYALWYQAFEKDGLDAIASVEAISASPWRN